MLVKVVYGAKSLQLNLSDEMTLVDMMAVIEAEWNVKQNEVYVSNRAGVIFKSFDRSLIESGISNGDEIFITAANRSNIDVFNTSSETGQKMMNLLKNPFSHESQEYIYEKIKKENIDRSLRHAHEFIPESFTQITMLYVYLLINDIPVVAFIDSGAQATIMSRRCAEKCNLLHLLDTRFDGTVRGIGEGCMLGRIHVATLQLGGKLIEASINIIDNDDIGFVLGLDLLRRYLCKIDLKANKLIIDDEEIPFLAEHEIEMYKQLPSSK